MRVIKLGGRIDVERNVEVEIGVVARLGLDIVDDDKIMVDLGCLWS